MSVNLKSNEELEQQLRICTRSLHEDFNDTEKSNFWRGQISALEWVLGKED